MQTQEFICAILHSLPEYKVEGKKRLQKFTYLLKEAGADCEASFILKNFGPYSADVDQSALLLSMLGGIEETSKSVGTNGYLATVFTLPAADVDKSPVLDEKTAEKLAALDKFSTLELEIASTIRYFMNQGNDYNGAVNLTSEMKPTKSLPRVISKASEILELL